MKTILALAFMLLVPFSVYAQSITWNANTEPDMKDYGVYSCTPVGCTVVKSAAMFKGFVNHPTVTFLLLPGTQGSIAVTARDTSLNESGLSVSIPFDLIAPQTPVNLRQVP